MPHREKLVELLQSAHDARLFAPYIKPSDAEALADYLIENGVTIQEIAIAKTREDQKKRREENEKKGTP